MLCFIYVPPALVEYADGKLKRNQQGHYKNPLQVSIDTICAVVAEKHISNINVLRSQQPVHIHFKISILRDFLLKSIQIKLSNICSIPRYGFPNKTIEIYNVSQFVRLQ